MAAQILVREALELSAALFERQLGQGAAILIGEQIVPWIGVSFGILAS